MNDFKSLLDQLRTQPETYLGRESISKLTSFLDGYCQRSWALRFGLDSFLLKFQGWAIKQHQVRTDDAWDSIILFIERHDEARAFRKFFQLIEEFQKETGIMCSPMQFKFRGKAPELLRDRDFPYDEDQFFSLLSRIREHPEMYMNETISRISAFIDGYFLACSFDPPRSHPLWVRFTAWLKAEQELAGDYRWEDILLFSLKSEELGFTVFFEAFEQFLAEEWFKP